MKLNKEKVNRFIDEFKNENLKEFIKINLEVKEAGLTESRVGGLFYLPKNSNIPVNQDGDQLMFLAQINCEELPENSIYTRKGIVQFWIFGGESLMGADFDNLLSDNNKRVIYYPNIEDHFSKEYLEETYKPKDDGELYTPICDEKEFGMIFEAGNQWIIPTDYRFEEKFVKKWNEIFPEYSVEASYELYNTDCEDDYIAILESLDVDNHTQIGGYAYFTQEDPRNYSDFIKYEHILFQLDSEYADETDNILWGDCGVGNFFATDEQLKQMSFEETIYTWDCF